MSEQMPPQFEWIKPGVKVVDIAEDCPICADVYEVATAPKWNQIYGAWLVKIVDEDGYHDCSTIKQADQTIALTLTREQANQLLLCVDAGLCWHKNFKEMFKHFGRATFHKKDLWFMRSFRVRAVQSIKKQIEEKLNGL